MLQARVSVRKRVLPRGVCRERCSVRRRMRACTVLTTHADGCAQANEREEAHHGAGHGALAEGLHDHGAVGRLHGCWLRLLCAGADADAGSGDGGGGTAVVSTVQSAPMPAAHARCHRAGPAVTVQTHVTPARSTRAADTGVGGTAAQTANPQTHSRRTCVSVAKGLVVSQRSPTRSTVERFDSKMHSRWHHHRDASCNTTCTLCAGVVGRNTAATARLRHRWTHGTVLVHGVRVQVSPAAFPGGVCAARASAHHLGARADARCLTPPLLLPGARHLRRVQWYLQPAHNAPASCT